MLGTEWPRRSAASISHAFDYDKFFSFSLTPRLPLKRNTILQTNPIPSRSHCLSSLVYRLPVVGPVQDFRKRITYFSALTAALTFSLSLLFLSPFIL